MSLTGDPITDDETAKAERDIREAVHIITFLRKVADPDLVTEMLSAWAAMNPDVVVRACLALSDPDAEIPATPEHVLREAHAAHMRGDKSTVVRELEREYQRNRKRANRVYSALRRSRPGAA